MIPLQTRDSVSRRTALAALGTGALGIALAPSVQTGNAQESTPMAGHPVLGTWIFDRDITADSDAPSIVVLTADGGLTDPSKRVAGVWIATGPRSAAWTLIEFIQEGEGGYVAVRSTVDIDDGNDTLVGPYSFTIVAPDGSVLMSGEGSSTASRLKVEAIEEGGKPLAGFPTWIPAPPPEATPAT